LFLIIIASARFKRCAPIPMNRNRTRMSLEKCHGRKRIQPLVDADAFKILKQAADRQPRVMTLPEGLYSAPWKRTSFGYEKLG